MSIFGNDFNSLFESELKKIEKEGTSTQYYLAEDDYKEIFCVESSDGNLYDTLGNKHSTHDTNRYRYMIENSILIPKSIL